MVFYNKHNNIYNILLYNELFFFSCNTCLLVSSGRRSKVTKYRTQDPFQKKHGDMLFCIYSGLFKNRS